MPDARATDIGLIRSAFLEGLAHLLADDLRFQGVLGVEIGGSVGRGEADPLSDIDLFMYVAVAEFDAYCDGFAFELLESAGPVRRRRGPSFAPFIGWGYTVDYGEIGLVQLFVRSDAALRPSYLQRQGRILFERDGRLSSNLAAAKAEVLPSRSIAAAALSEIYFRLFNVTKELARGHTWQARKYHREIQEQLLVLARLASAQEPAGSYFRHSGRAMEQELPHVWRSAIEELDRQSTDQLGEPVVRATVALAARLQDALAPQIDAPVDWAALEDRILHRLTAPAGPS